MKITFLFAAMCTAVASPLRAVASDIHWSNPLGGSFGELTNWSEGVVPGPTDTGIFATGSPLYPVLLDADRSLAGLSIYDDSVAFDLGGFQLSVVDLSVAAFQQSHVEFSNGSVVVSEGFNLMPVPIPDPHQGLHEAVLRGSTTTGIFPWIRAFGNGAGRLRIDEGAVVQITSPAGTGNTGLSIGSRNATAIVEVSGSSMLAVASSIRVGEISTRHASLHIAGGSQVNSRDTPGDSAGIVGYGSPLQRAFGSVVITGQSSTWVMDGRLTLGNRWADGNVRVLAGGYMESTSGRVAREATATGNLLIDGPGSEYHVTERLFVGGSETAPGGVGTVAVQNSGRLEVGQQLHVWNSGTVSLDASSFAVVGDAPDIAGAVHVGVGGTLLGNGTIVADVVNSGGVVSPGASPGLLTIGGDFEQSHGSDLLIELGGLIPGEEFDVLNVLGTATLGGDLRVTAIDGFTPTPGDTFEFLLADDRYGVFDSFIDETGFGLQLNFTGAVGTLTATVPEPGTGALILLLLALPVVRR